MCDGLVGTEEFQQMEMGSCSQPQSDKGFHDIYSNKKADAN